jgi:WD40 repeat protein
VSQGGHGEEDLFGVGDRSVVNLAINSSGTRFAVIVGGGKRVVVRDSSGTELSQYSLERSMARVVSFGPQDGDGLAIGTDHGALLWNWTAQDDSSEILSGAPVRALEWNDAGQALALAVGRQLIVWREGAHSLQRFEPVGADVVSVAFSGDGLLVAAGDGRGRVSVWDIDSGQPLLSPTERHDNAVSGLAFHPDGRWLVSLGRDGRVFAWDLDPDAWLRRSCSVASSFELTDEEWTGVVHTSVERSPLCGEPG